MPPAGIFFSKKNWKRQVRRKGREGANWCQPSFEGCHKSFANLTQIFVVKAVAPATGHIGGCLAANRATDEDIRKKYGRSVCEYRRGSSDDDRDYRAFGGWKVNTA